MTEYKIDPSHFRAQVKNISGRDISSEQAKHFLDMFQNDIQTAVNAAVGNFIFRHFGAKGSSDAADRS